MNYIIVYIEHHVHCSNIIYSGFSRDPCTLGGSWGPGYRGLQGTIGFHPGFLLGGGGVIEGYVPPAVLSPK